MDHLYLRTMPQHPLRPGHIGWILTVGDSPSLDGETRMFSGYTPLQDEEHVTAAYTLDSASAVFTGWLRALRDGTIPLF